MTQTLLNLQRTRGNRYVERLLSASAMKQGCACGGGSRTLQEECEECKNKTLERRRKRSAETLTAAPSQQRETDFRLPPPRQSFLMNSFGTEKAAVSNPFRGPLTTATASTIQERKGALAVGSSNTLTVDEASGETRLTNGDGGATPASGCVLTGAFSTIPSGPLAATLNSSGGLGASFQMIGDFNVDPIPPCICGPGEYRQYVRGTISRNGTNLVFPMCGYNLHPTRFQEDCAISGGTQYRYGYRSQPFATSNFTPDQQIGCRFEGVDDPRVFGSTGETLGIDVEFNGQLVNRITGAVLASSTWTVQGTATVP
jgi:hypothetical protein